jgi:hypothetical protein
MTDIQRWAMNHVQGEVYIDRNLEGSWVTFADAEAAIAAAREETLAAAVQRVTALPQYALRDTCVHAIEDIRKEEK